MLAKEFEDAYTPINSFMTDAFYESPSIEPKAQSFNHHQKPNEWSNYGFNGKNNYKRENIKTFNNLNNLENNSIPRCSPHANVSDNNDGW